MTTVRRRLLHLESGQRRWRVDELAVEEPLELRVAGEPLTVTMRTPGNDFDLAVGFLLTEGLLESAAQIAEIRTCEDRVTGRHNLLEVRLRSGVAWQRPELARAFASTSACGVCGAASIESVRARARHALVDDAVTVPAALLAALPDRLRESQRVFARTGGLHAAGLFTTAGELVCLREDVGRHNAFDKVIGWAATQDRLPLRGHVMVASGRASFELTQKALMAGIPVLVAVSAPSSLAVELAESAGMTLVGFARGGAMNVYAGVQRVAG